MVIASPCEVRQAEGGGVCVFLAAVRMSSVQGGFRYGMSCDITDRHEGSQIGGILGDSNQDIIACKLHLILAT